MSRLPATPIMIVTALSRAAPACCRPITISRFASHYLFANRTGWRKDAAVGKTVVSSSMIDRVAAKLGRKLYEVPVGFKWFVDGLLRGSLGFRRRGERGRFVPVRAMGRPGPRIKTASSRRCSPPKSPRARVRDPGEIYAQLEREYGASVIRTYRRAGQRRATRRARQIVAPGYYGHRTRGRKNPEDPYHRARATAIRSGGIKVIAENGWFAARPSGTEDVYKIYAESFRGADHLKKIQEEAQAMVGAVLGAVVA